MSAGAGADFLDGGSGNDLAVGGPGEDTLVGWDGAGGQDTLRGGAGADVFYFGVPSADEGDASADFVRIEDFTDGEDRLQISTLGTLTAGIDDVRATQTEDGVLIDGVEVPIPGAPGGGQILLAGFSLSNLDASDFRIMDQRVTDESTGFTTIEVGKGPMLLVSGDGGWWIGGRGYDDNLVGGAGRDTLEGNAGADRLDGGEGRDVVTYQFSPSGVQVDLRAGTGRGGDASGDTLWGIEDIIGSAYADTLIGDDHDNVIEGRAGADFLLGGGGNDWVSYDYSRAPVNVSLKTGLGSGGHAGGDTLQGFEGLEGSFFADTLEGGGGNDRLYGGGGDDFLIGGTGNDFLRGDAGADIFVFSEGHGDDTVTGFVDGEDLIDLTAFSSDAFITIVDDGIDPTGSGLTGFGDLTLTAEAGGVLLDLTDVGGGVVHFRALALGDLGAADFVF